MSLGKKTINIIGITDIHGQVEAVEAIADQLRSADLLLLAGDITHFGGEEKAAEVVSRLKKYSKHLFAVPGNCDYPGVDIFLTEQGINLHQRLESTADIRILGLGGSTPAPVDTPFVYSEEEYEAMLRGMASEIKGAKSILVSHQPPIQTKTDRVMKVKHVGSKSVRFFIEHYQPLVCLTGHIHESRGVDTIGRSTIVNPGPFKDGRYCFMSIERERVEVELRKV